MSKRARFDHPWCRVHELAGVAEPATVCDHAVRIAAGGATWDSENHLTLCGPCHNTKSGLEANDRMPIDTRAGLDGLVPVDREAVYTYLFEYIFNSDL